jgi:predicted transcriptional regulator of viral defense system
MRLWGENMIKTTAIILEELKSYASPASKLSRMVKNGEYVKVVKGLYETNPSTPGYLLAGSIYGPSYLSFEFALAYHGLIPEAVYTFTSATYDKKKKKKFETDFGTFTYRDVPKEAYSLGVDIVREGDYSFWIASPEKALCDELYTKGPVANQKELQSLLFDDMRIDEQEFGNMNYNDILLLEQRYHSTNIQKLSRLMRRRSKK